MSTGLESGREEGYDEALHYRCSLFALSIGCVFIIMFVSTIGPNLREQAYHISEYNRTTDLRTIGIFEERRGLHHGFIRSLMDCTALLQVV